jgi:hypothetical protein
MEMTSTRSAGTRPVPKARADGLLVQELMDEVVVYDLDRHRSHCLNRTAALIWRHCDGSTSVAEMARRLQQDSGVPVDEEAVWLALDRLSKAYLLQERVRHPAWGDRTTRRTIIRRLAAVGAVALVSSVVAPGASAAGSVPSSCFSNCCTGGTTGCQSGHFGNNCKCCFNTTTGAGFCAGDCTTCQNAGTTCVQLPNCCNHGTC